MNRLTAVCLVLIGVVVSASCRNATTVNDDEGLRTAAHGTVHGRARMLHPVPENERLRMEADPMCARATGGQRVLDDAVIVAADGGVANVFIELVGAFPSRPVPREPVSVNQRGCRYQPRVVGLRVGQSLDVRNSDEGLHNVHGVSTDHDSFNVSQPLSGMSNTFHPREPGILRLKCDVHTWMIAFVGVVTHPYFAVTGADGTFTLREVPEGTYGVRAWHERFGTISSQVRIEAGHDAIVEMTYAATDTPAP